MLIGFAGKRTAGKTTAAQILIHEFGFAQAKFAFALKEGIRTAYGLTPEQTDGKLKEAETDLLGGETPRTAMEWFGEESRKLFGEDIWVKRWFALNAHAVKRGDHFVFDDVRNEVEASAIRAAGGKVIRIYNPQADALEMLPSEAGLNEIRANFVLANNLTERFTDDVRSLAMFQLGFRDTCAA